MKEITGKDLICAFNSACGMVGFKYLISSYYHPLSFVSGNTQETAYNEGKRAVVVHLIDTMRAADPKITAKMLSDVEYMILEDRHGRKKDNLQDCPSPDESDDD